MGNLTNAIVDRSGLSLWTASTFDNLNRLSNQQSAIGSRQFEYDSLGRVTNTVDAATKDWATEYDALGRVKKSYRPSGNYEEYDFDALGNRTHFWNAERKPMNFGFDAQGRVTSITNAINKVTSFSYDDAGNLTNREDAKGAATEYGYDVLNRLVAVTNEGIEVATFNHDNSGNLVGQTSLSADCSYGYDEMNRLTASTQSVYSVSSVVQNHYDLNGNRTNIVYPGGLSVAYNYEADNRLQSVSISAPSAPLREISFSYDTASRLTGISYPNGVDSTFGYDAESRNISLTTINQEPATLIDRTIRRNPLGFKHTELIDAGLKPTAPENGRRVKTHNDADQLTSEWVQLGTNESTVSYTYSANGCLTNILAEAQSTQSFEYDYDNRILSAGGSQASATEYIYDASGARVGRIAGGSPAATNFFVIDQADGLKRPLAETDSSGTVTRYYVWSGMSLLCHIESNGDIFYYHSDELGSTLALTDNTGSVTDQYAYMPYGYATHTGSTQTPFQWLGGYGVYYDVDTKLHLTLHRAYSCSLKRFIQPDPLGIDGGVNVYMWANVNPLFFIDPYGLCAESGSSSSGGFMGWLDRVGWQLESWAVDNRVQTAASYAEDAAAYQDYLTNPDYAEVREISDAAKSVVTKLEVAGMAYGAYKLLTMPPGTSSYKNISTGRTTPKSLKEQLAMQEVMSNPSGTTPPRMPKMSDSKNGLFAKDGWVKRSQNVNGVEIHYIENIKTKQVTDFKFKD